MLCTCLKLNKWRLLRLLLSISISEGHDGDIRQLLVYQKGH